MRRYSKQLNTHDTGTEWHRLEVTGSARIANYLTPSWDVVGGHTWTVVPVHQELW